ncbi:class IV adenylate cyclase [Desulfobotulus sp. H1]|uniref:Class IV adenylate cyclase n=1 Tax=Desulfobotulus pelophilus TaxID=2823377 RepID=A0ABT3N5M1_9BACT|nr:class IV adenylate cyclase [Desulfobotulus pelophilus]MCW7752758.1 class IV adenylate cyclase [Desulfobotulus pelophilus]
MNHNDLEIEVKFHISNPAGFRNLILAQNGISMGKIFEKNTLFDTPDLRLRKQGILLRLRQAENCIMTVKSHPGNHHDPDFKILQETETVVGSFTDARQAFRTLGYTHETIYEKYRESFHLKGVEVCLDQMPFGFFAELEGTKNNIRTIAGLLGLDWCMRQTLSYRALFERLAQHHGYSFSDITFTAFQNMPADISAILS